MSKGKQLTLLVYEEQSLSDEEKEIASIEAMMKRLELARLCVGHNQKSRAVNNLLLVRADINKLVKRLKDRS